MGGGGAPGGFRGREGTHGVAHGVAMPKVVGAAEESWRRCKRRRRHVVVDGEKLESWLEESERERGEEGGERGVEGACDAHLKKLGGGRERRMGSAGFAAALSDVARGWYGGSRAWGRECVAVADAAEKGGDTL